MNRCDACAHWKRSEFRAGFGDCNMPGDGDILMPHYRAAIYGPYGEGGNLVTRPDFGCTEWEEKAKP